jgi:hypothetical protein
MYMYSVSTTLAMPWKNQASVLEKKTNAHPATDSSKLSADSFDSTALSVSAKNRAGTVIELVFPFNDTIDRNLAAVVMAKAKNYDTALFQPWLINIIQQLDLTSHLHPSIQARLNTEGKLAKASNQPYVSLPGKKTDRTQLYQTKLEQTDWAIKFIKTLLPTVTLTFEQHQNLDTLLLERNAQSKESVFIVLPNSANPKINEAYNPISFMMATPSRTAGIMKAHGAIPTLNTHERSHSPANAASLLNHQKLQETILNWLLEQGIIANEPVLQEIRLSTLPTKKGAENLYPFILLAPSEYQRVEKSAQTVQEALIASGRLLPNQREC